MPSKFLVPFELPDYQGVPVSTADPGFVLAYIKHGWWTKHTGIEETDLVLQRPLDGFTEVDRYANPVMASDTVLGAIEKIQRSLSTLKLVGDVTGTATYTGGELVIQTTGGGGIDCTELLNCQVIIDIQGDITTLQGDVTSIYGSIDIILADIINLQGSVSILETAVTGIQGDIVTIYGQTSDIDGRVTNLENASAPLKVATQLDSYHFSGYGTQYEVGDLVYYQGHIYSALANNDGVPPVIGGNAYWTDLGVGNRLRQILSDWNATTGEAQILNKPTALSQFTNDAGFITSFTETDPIFTASAAAAISSTDITNWNTAYGWGDHSTAGYITAEADTLNSVTTRGNTTLNTITVGGITATGVTSTIYAGTATRLRTEANNLVFERESSSGFMKFYINQTTLSPSAKSYLGYNNATLNVVLSNEYSTGNLELRTQDIIRQQIFANGNVVIGSSSPTDAGYKLDVNGSVRAQGIFYGIDIRTGAHSFRDQMHISHTADGFTRQSAYNAAGAHALTFIGDLRFASSAAIKSVFAFNATYSNNGTIHTGGQSLIKIFTGDAIGNTVNTTGLDNYGINLMPTLNYTTGTSTFTGFYYNPTVTATTGLTHYAMDLVTGLVKFRVLAGIDTRMVVADSAGVLSTQSIPEMPQYGLQDVITNNALLNQINNIDVAGYDFFWDNVGKYSFNSTKFVDINVDDSVQQARLMVSVFGGGDAYITLIASGASGAAGIDVMPTGIYIKTLNYSSASTGDVLTLVDPASGEVEFQTAPGGGIALTDLSATAPVQYNNTTGVFSITQATTTTDGYLSAAHWNTFNGKQAALVSGTNIKSIHGDTLLGSGNELVFDGDRSKYGYEFFNDFLTTVSTSGGTDGSGHTAFWSGAGATVVPSSVPTVRATNQQGFIQPATGTTATGVSGIFGTTTASNFLITGGGEMVYETSVFIPILSTATERYRIVIGYGSVATNSAETNGVFFTYDEGGTLNGSVASANWQCLSVANSVRTQTTTAVAVSNSAWVKLKVVINAAGNSAQYFINDMAVAVATHSTNIPTGASQTIVAKLNIAKAVGTTSRTFFADYLYYRQTYTNTK